MRWIVEVMSLGKTERDSLYVDADSWQKALQVARTLRGESDPMSGFSIELLEEGCRAVDPTTRMVYAVHRAPDDGRHAGRPSAAPSKAAPAPEAHVGRSAPAASGPPAEAQAPRSPAVASAAPEETLPRTRSAIPSRPQISATATMAIGSPVPPSVAPPRAQPASSTLVPPSTGLPSQIVFKREQDATEALPLTYREYVYVVPPGSTEMAAATLAQTQLELVRASLDRMPAGKLVNLAVFDVAFQGKPPVPPLVTLAWKDWRGVALVSFPRQPGRAPVTIPTGASPRVSIPVSVPVIPSAQASASPAPVALASSSGSVPAPVFQASAQARKAASETPAPAPVFVAPASGPPLYASSPATPPVVPMNSPAPPPVLPVSSPAPPPVSHSPLVTAIASASSAPGFSGGPQVFTVSQPTFPPAEFFANPAGPVITESLAPLGRAVLSQPAPTRVAFGTPSGRIFGEELIADLFESMHELHFSRDAVEGGDFCLALAMSKLPSLAGIVELYDIDRREFLVTSTRGEVATKLLLRRFPETDGILAAAMRKRRAIVLVNALDSDAATNERYAAIGGARSLIVAPVMQAGRFLGAIELLNPLDGAPFTEADGNAVTYIAEQLAEFVATRGIVTDPVRISARPPQ